MGTIEKTALKRKEVLYRSSSYPSTPNLPVKVARRPLVCTDIQTKRSSSLQWKLALMKRNGTGMDMNRGCFTTVTDSEFSLIARNRLVIVLCSRRIIERHSASYRVWASFMIEMAAHKLHSLPGDLFTSIRLNPTQ